MMHHTNRQGSANERDAMLSVTRRSFVTLTVAGAGAAALSLLLGGCAESSEPSLPFEMPEALGDGFPAVQNAVSALAPDAKLIAMRLSSPIPASAASDASIAWMYLFGSAQAGASYTAADPKGSTPSVSRYRAYALTEEQWQSVPGIDEIALDAPDALRMVLDEHGKDIEAAATCNAYLMTYIAEDADPSADAMKWFLDFSFEAQGQEEAYRLFSVDVRSGAVEEL